jgi:hypothetical protein
MSTSRKFQVIGMDDLGDVHTFSSDDRERAEQVSELMREELESVRLIDAEHAAAGSGGPPEALAFWKQAVADCDVELGNETPAGEPAFKSDRPD